MRNARHFVLTAGLAGILAFGAVGCTSTTTTKTEITDENGTTTTETTTTTNENGQTSTSTTTTTTSGDAITYSNEALNIEATLPSSFQHAKDEGNLDGEETVLYATDDHGDTVFIIARDLSVEPKFEGSKPWAEYYSEAMTQQIKEDGETDIKAELSEGKFAGVPCMILELRSKGPDGGELYRDYFFIVGDTADGLMGLNFGVTAHSEDELTEIENCFVSTQPSN